MQTPAAWQRAWDGPDNPQTYISALMHRAKAIQLIWLARAKTDTLITGDALDLSQLFRPATFLNAYRQTVARQLRRNMDELSLQCQWGGGGNGGGGLKLVGIQMQVRRCCDCGHSPRPFRVHKWTRPAALYAMSVMTPRPFPTCHN